MKTVICTTGTSIAAGCEILPRFLKGELVGEDEISQLEREIEIRLERYDLSTEAGRNGASAELNSLHRLGLDSNDHIVLLSTDTEEGEICSKKVSQCLSKYFEIPIDNIAVKRIEGLQVRDSQLLRSTGLPRLVELIWDEIDHARNTRLDDVILNPTGGFKGIVPFITVIGMLKRLRTVYVFEFAATLVSLPPLPITFDLNLYYRALPALELVGRESAVAPEQFYSLIEDFHESEKALFSGFLEPIDHLVTLSPLAFTLLRIDEQGARNVFLSPEVRTRLDAATGLDRITIERLLTKLTYPAWRAVHYHRFTGTDLDVFKPGRVGERAACANDQEQGKVFVCMVYLSHDEYERDLPGRTRDQFDLESFQEWKPDLDLPTLNAEVTSEQETQMAELINERNDLRNRLRDAGQPYRDQINRLKSQAGVIPGLKRKIQELEGLNRELEKRLETANRVIATIQDEP